MEFCSGRKLVSLKDLHNDLLFLKHIFWTLSLIKFEALLHLGSYIKWVKPVGRSVKIVKVLMFYNRSCIQNVFALYPGAKLELTKASVVKTHEGEQHQRNYLKSLYILHSITDVCPPLPTLLLSHGNNLVIYTPAGLASVLSRLFQDR